MLKPAEINIVIYHYPCPDGTGAALAVKYYFDCNYPDTQIEYFPLEIGKSPPVMKDKNILIADLPMSSDNIDKLRLNNRILIIDHHKTNESDMKNISANEKIFDMQHSGAFLVWQYFHPNIEIPLLIKYIEDRDLWNNKLSDNEYFSSWIRSFEPNIQAYYPYLNDTRFSNTIHDTGKSLLEYNKSMIEIACKYSLIRFVKIQENNRYYIVAQTNSTVLQSEIAAELINKYPFINFSIVYYTNDKNEKNHYCLRSNDTHTDVSQICKLYGGGGHRNASGIQTQLSQIGTTIRKGITIVDELIEHIKLDNPNVIYDGYLNDTRYVDHDHKIVTNKQALLNIYNK